MRQLFGVKRCVTASSLYKHTATTPSSYLDTDRQHRLSVPCPHMGSGCWDPAMAIPYSLAESSGRECPGEGIHDDVTKVADVSFCFIVLYNFHVIIQDPI